MDDAISISIRRATPADLPALLELEQQWDEPSLRSSEDVVKARLQRHPEGQLVAVKRGTEAVVAVLYTQRVTSPDVLLSATRQSEPALHTAVGASVQLLGVLSGPGAAGTGAALRTHVLQLAQAEGLRSACAVTRCRDWDRTSPYAEHVASGDDRGLRFHTAAGARIVGLVPGYRPLDTRRAA